MIALEQLDAELSGRRLPGGSIEVAPYESAIADHALLSPDDGSTGAHPVWLVVASLRGLGISVEELCSLAHKEPDDTLLLGTIDICQQRTFEVGTSYRTQASVVEVGRKQMRDGNTLDSLVVEVLVIAADQNDDGQGPTGTVTSTYLIKRAPR